MKQGNSLNPIKLLQDILYELRLLRISYEAVHKPEMEYAKQRLEYSKHPIARSRLAEHATQEKIVLDPDWEWEMLGDDKDKETMESVLGKEI